MKFDRLLLSNMPTVVFAAAGVLLTTGVAAAFDLSSTRAAPEDNEQSQFSDASVLQAAPQRTGFFVDFIPVNEARIGLNAHNPTGVESGVDLKGEALSSPIFKTDETSRYRWFIPRLNLGGSLNTEDGTSYVYSGLVWTIPLTERLFVEGQFGFAAHNGKFANRNYDNLGDCNWSFREGASVGVKLDEHWAVLAGIEHLSQAGLCSGGNAGLTNYGVKLSYAF